MVCMVQIKYITLTFAIITVKQYTTIIRICLSSGQFRSLVYTCLKNGLIWDSLLYTWDLFIKTNQSAVLRLPDSNLKT